MRVKARLRILLNKYSCVKFSILFVIILIVSISLVGNITYSILYPVKYPTSNMEDIIRLRDVTYGEYILIQGDFDVYISIQVDGDYNLTSSIFSTDAPILTNQRIDVIISSLYEIQLDCVIEIYLFEDANVSIREFILFKCDLVDNLKIHLDGKIINYYRINWGGEMYYAFTGLNLTEKDKISRLEVSFNLKRTTGKSEISRVPWIFNEKYAKLIDLPIFSMPLNSDSISDLYLTYIDFRMPIEKILTKQSGWVDLFCGPINEEILINGYLKIDTFTYPINQTIRRDGNSYYFETRFSEENIADRFLLIIVPELRVMITIIIFLFSPFYIPLFKWLENRKTNENLNLNSNKLVEHILKISKIYLGLLFSIVLNIFIGEYPPIFWTYIFEITNLIYFVIILAYPALSYIIYNRVLDERNS